MCRTQNKYDGFSLDSMFIDKSSFGCPGTALCSQSGRFWVTWGHFLRSLRASRFCRKQFRTCDSSSNGDVLFLFRASSSHVLVSPTRAKMDACCVLQQKHPQAFISYGQSQGRAHEPKVRGARANPFCYEPRYTYQDAECRNAIVFESRSR